MPRDNPTNVVASFDLLLEEIEAEIDLVSRMGARAFENRDFDGAQETLRRAGVITAFRDRVDSLRREWTSTVGQQLEEEDEEGVEHVQRRDLGRLRRGLRTPEEAYYRPILQALVESGGSAPLIQILDRVGRIMQGTL